MCSLNETIRLAKSNFLPSETELLLTRFNSNVGLDKCGKSSDNVFCFYSWLVGFTDGGGCFNIYTSFKNNKIIFTFKIGQKLNNKQILYFIKKNLNCGSVSLDYKNGMANFLVRDRTSLITKILPIFDRFKLLTSKEYSYLLFKNCLFISLKNDLSQTEKIHLISNKKLEVLPNTFISSSLQNINFWISKSWLIGFIEAKGSFYITKKDENRLVHSFGITQNRDKILLERIRLLLKIESSVLWDKHNFFSLSSTNYDNLRFIKKYFFNCFKSRKALVYRIWARSFRDRNNHKQLLFIQNKIRILAKED